MEALDDIFIDELLTPDPIQYFDWTLRCASRGCGSPTNRKLYGVPYCFPHILDRVNTLLKEHSGNSSRPT